MKETEREREKKMENSYWCGTGKYQEEYNTLQKALVPPIGEAPTRHGELLRSFSNYYYDYFNNGGGNNRYKEFRSSLQKFPIKKIPHNVLLYRVPQNDNEWDLLADAVIQFVLAIENEFAPSVESAEIS